MAQRILPSRGLRAIVLLGKAAKSGVNRLVQRTGICKEPRTCLFRRLELHFVASCWKFHRKPTEKRKFVVSGYVHLFTLQMVKTTIPEVSLIKRGRIQGPSFSLRASSRIKSTSRVRALFFSVRLQLIVTGVERDFRESEPELP